MTRTAQVDVVAPPVQPVVQASAQATEGQTALSASVPAQDGCTFAWTLTSGTVTAGQGTAQITFTAGAAGSLGISCVASSAHSLALAANGPVWAWGYNSYAQLGDGTLISRTSPVLVPGLTGVTALGAGSTFSAALLADGMVSTWGWLPTLASQAPPGVLPGSANTTALAAGRQRLLTLQSDGSVRSIGYATYGQTGLGNRDDVGVLTAIPGLAGVQGIAAAGFTSFAWGATFAKSWGDDTYGNLGLGRIVVRPTPARIEGHTGW